MLTWSEDAVDAVDAQWIEAALIPDLFVMHYAAVLQFLLAAHSQFMQVCEFMHY